MAYDWKTGLTSALTTGATGFAMGGLPGGIVGLGLGGATGFMGGNDKMKKLPTMSKPQQAILNQLLQMIGPQGGLGDGYQEAANLQRQYMDPSSQAVEQFAQPYMNQFNQQIVPNLAERFAGFGGMGGGLSSSGFGQALGAAGGNLQTQLAALKAGLGQQAAQNLMGQYGNLLGIGLNASPFAYTRPQQSGAQGALQGYFNAGMPGLAQLSDAYQKHMPIMGSI